MALQPDQPFPKTRGNPIRAEDWNETINEVVRLDTAKLNQSGGTVSGNLAVTGTISGRLANGAVGQPQLADNAVTTNKISPGTITVEKLQGGYWLTNAMVTLAASARQEIYIEFFNTPTGSPGSTPTYFSHPLVFIATSTAQAGFDYWLRYNTYSDTGSDLQGWHSVVVENRVPFAIQLHITSYIHGLTVPPF
jgi:hypothetical protein